MKQASFNENVVLIAIISGFECISPTHAAWGRMAGLYTMKDKSVIF